MRKNFKYLAIVGIVVFAFFGATQCSNKKINASQSQFTEVISGFSAGVISNNSSIKIRFMDPVSQKVRDEVITKSLFSVKPKIEGTNNWIDENTLEYIPSELMPSGEKFKVTFLVDEIYNNIDLPDFEFEFQTLQQAVFPDFIGLQHEDQDDYKNIVYNGEIKTADFAEFDKVQSLIKASQNGTSLEIKWKAADMENHFLFSVSGVKRENNESKLKLVWDGSVINGTNSGTEIISIPAIGDFKLINYTIHNHPNQEIILHFSDPILKKQNLNGLVTLNNYKGNLKFSIEGNDIHIYGNTAFVGENNIVVEKEIKNTLGKTLKETYQNTVQFENIKPSIEMIGSGVILPSTDGLIFPFKAVSLRAVNVKIIRVFEKNISQFFQKNQFNGYSEINRVGNIVFKKEVDLISDNPVDYSKWNTFSLDLASMLEIEKGAIYRVVISFDKSQSLYRCEGENKSVESNYEINANDLRTFNQPNQYYNDIENNYYSYYYYDGYDDPCKDNYYRSRERIIATNILASDLGIIAKNAEGNSLHAYVTDLKTTEPLNNVTVELFDYQNQIIGTAQTNDKGMVAIDISKKPFLLVAKKEKERGYLKLDDGNSLSLSMFNVSGQQLKKGVKGFIYGERGVWRPGDSLFMSFILEDKGQLLPKDQPVIFELFGPDNKVRHKKVRTHSINGFYDFRTKTESSDKTGNWRAQVSVGGSVFSKILKIETVKPNRLKIKMAFNGKKVINPFDTKEGDIQVNWLHGAIAKQLKTNVEMSLSSGKTSFEDYTSFIFDDPSKNFYSKNTTVFEGKTDDKGHILFNPKINVKKNAPGMLKANFKTRVFEEGGDFSVDNYSIKYSPFYSYVGVKVPEGKGWNGALFSNEKNIIPIACVDKDGNPIDRNGLLVEVFDIRWRWWWETSNYNDLASYVSNKSANLIHSGTINARNGKANYALEFNQNLYGRKLIRITDPVSGHSTGQIFYLTYSGWWNRGGGDSGMGAEMLTFSLEKKEYEVGDEVEINIPEFETGRALISIESASGVVNSFWATSQDAENGLSFEATPEMSPNVYVHIAMIQPHSNKENDLPMRLYGVESIKVVNAETILEPEIEMPDEIEPEKDFSVKISESNGKKMTYTIAVVDEGLLDLTSFKTPKPWDYFYAKEALGVKTWDMYKYVISANKGEMAGLLALGGDDEAKEKESSKVNRFKPVVMFLGPFELDGDSENKHLIHMPNYVGSVRTMVIAGQNNCYGSTEATTPVRKPLMVLATLPRVISPGESVALPVNIFAMDESIKKVKVEVKTNELLKINGSNTKEVLFDEIGDQVVNYTLNTPEITGKATVEVTVSSGKNTASHKIEIEVRTPNPEVDEFQFSTLEKGKSWSIDYEKIGIYGTNSGTVEVSSIPPLDLSKRLKYLIRYPHGCIEQTTSSVFPQLFLSKVMDLNEKELDNLEKNIKAGIKRLKTFQVSNGGLSYWPGENDASSWGTNYGGHFLVEAKIMGYAVPDGMMKGILKYQKQKANKWKRDGSYYNHPHGKESDEIIQSYRLYTLALGEKPALGAMNRMKEMQNVSNIALWRLAGAYALIGKEKIANEIIADLNTDIKPYREMRHSYGSSLRDQAMILEVLNLTNDKLKGKKMFDAIAKQLSSNNWHSTQTTAYSLLGLSKFIGNISQQGLNYSFINNGKSTNISSKNPIHQNDLEMKNGVNQLQITNNGGDLIFIKIKNSGVPLNADIKEEENNISMSIKYLNMKGENISPYVLDQGTDFMAEVVIKNTSYQDLHQLALSQMFPSGWEIRNTRMDNVSSSFLKDHPNYQDFRDDRVYSYFHLSRGQTKTFRVILNASYIGEFFLPITYCEAMYDNEYYSRKAGGKVKVIKAGGELSEVEE
tara:strand:+ start:1780 stop:7368 length:5589 start_codon:yes stop_codon:yes gene_type:complete